MKVKLEKLLSDFRGLIKEAEDDLNLKNSYIHHDDIIRLKAAWADMHWAIDKFPKK
jgi:hypothetical protein